MRLTTLLHSYQADPDTAHVLEPLQDLSIVLTYSHLLPAFSRSAMERRLFEEKLARFPKSKIWDKSTQISVDAVRSFIHRHPQPTISHIQKKSLQERPLKAPFHLIPDILPAPKEDDVEQLLCRTIDALGNIEYERPDLVSVPVEWIGRKIHSCIDRVEQSLHKRSGLRRLVKDSENDLTILHVHGGGFL